MQTLLVILTSASFCLVRGQLVARLAKNSTMPIYIAPTNSTWPLNGRIRISLLVGMRMQGSLGIGPVGPEGIRAAIDAIAEKNLLGDKYELVVEMYDSQCSRDIGIKKFFEKMAQNEHSPIRLPFLIGPLCTEQLFTGHMIKYYNYVALFMSSAAIDLYLNRQYYQYFNIMTPSTELFNYAVPDFILSQGWTKIFLLSETQVLQERLEQLLSAQLKASNITIVGTSKILYQIGQTVPTSDQVEDAIGFLKSLNPRIIIVNSNYGGAVACWLHRLGLFGPKYVFLLFAYSRFLPDSTQKYAWCTERMLFDVLRTSFYINHLGLLTSTTKTVDSIGKTSSWLNETLWNLGVNPSDDLYYYGCCRSFFYENIVVAALSLKNTENELESKNQTLADWITSSQNFKTKGHEIQQAFMRGISDVIYDGFTVSLNKSMTARRGLVGIFQQRVIEPSSSQTSGLSALVSTVLVGRYDSRDANPKIEWLRKIAWTTSNGLPPFDEVRIYDIKMPLIEANLNIGIMAPATILIVITVGLLILNVWRAQMLRRSLPSLNSALLAGDVLLLIGVLLQPTDGALNVHRNCMARSVLITLGFGLAMASLLAKMHIAGKLIVKQRNNSAKVTFNSDQSNSSRRKSIFQRIYRFLSIKRTQVNAVSSLKTPRSLKLKRYLKSTVISIIAFELLLTAILTVWFSLSPIETRVVKAESLIQSDGDLSTAFRGYCYACYLGRKSAVSTVAICFIFACFVVLFLRAFFLTLLLGKKTKLPEIDDLGMVTFASYGVPLIALSGSAVVGTLFNYSPMIIELSISVLALIIVAANLTLIFGSKIISGRYFSSKLQG